MERRTVYKNMAIANASKVALQALVDKYNLPIVESLELYAKVFSDTIDEWLDEKKLQEFLSTDE